MKKIFWLFVLILCVPYQAYSLTVDKCLSGDCQNGYGKARFKRGSTYEGQWKNGTMEGKGIYLYEKGNTGRKYQGDFKNGHFEGQGTFWAFDGSRFVGEWKRGQQSKGTFYFAKDKRRQCTGEWQGPYLNGRGTCWYTDGTKQEGIWKRGQYQGKK